MSRTIVHVGRKIKVAIDETTNADGTIVRRDVVLHPGAVAILPLLDDKVCLLRNYRPTAQDTLWEIPAGTLEVGEPIIEAAQRELAEETGYRAAHLEFLHAFFPSPGVMNERTHLFVASGLQPGKQALEADEQIEPVLVRWDDALQMVDDGTICDAKTIVALLLWERRTRTRVIESV
jgi:ADP-ribose pyrophosphatase